jgi:hypothetical protein
VRSSWSKHAVSGHVAVPAPDGGVLLLGGSRGENVPAAAIDRLDPATGRVASAGTLLYGRTGGVATPLPDGRVLLTGGNLNQPDWRLAEVVDPRTAQASAAGGMSVARLEHAAVALADGRVLVAGLAGRFERSASRLVLFERWQQDRVAVRLAFDSAAAEDAAEAACRLRGHTVTAGIVQAPVVPAAFECEFKRADGQPTARLEIRAAATATRDERHGRLDTGGATLEVRSLHRLEGTRLTLPHPAGYVFLHAGRPVAALELVGGPPRLWRPAEPAWNGPVLRACVALALLWDPAAATP